MLLMPALKLGFSDDLPNRLVGWGADCVLGECMHARIQQRRPRRMHASLFLLVIMLSHLLIPEDVLHSFLMMHAMDHNDENNKSCISLSQQRLWALGDSNMLTYIYKQSKGAGSGLCLPPWSPLHDIHGTACASSYLPSNLSACGPHNSNRMHTV